MVCYAIAGNSLDLFVGGSIFAALLLPPLAAIAGQLPGIGVCVLASTIGIGAVWFIPLINDAITFWQWWLCLGVLFTLLAVLGGAVGLLHALGFPPLTASGIVTILGVAWLTWPVWLAVPLAGSRLHWSILMHPLFAMNHVVAPLGIWTEQPAAYTLTNFGQDVQYNLPPTVWPVIIFQSGLAAALMLLSWRVGHCPAVNPSGKPAESASPASPGGR